MHRLRQLIAGVDATHPGLGKALAVAMLAVKANKTLLMIAPAGCGKSTLGRILSSSRQDVLWLDSVTRAGMRHLRKQLNDFTGVLYVDDLGKIDTYYSRISTVTGLCELVYSHFIAKHTQELSLHIANFQGSAIINAQPAVLKRIIATPEWEATVQDKTLRYYHLLRPTQPNLALPTVHLDWGLPLPGKRSLPRPNSKLEALLRIGAVQWSTARVQEHMIDLLYASAALDNRKKVTQEDIDLLYDLLRPMLVEHLLMRKASFEEGRDFDNNLLCVLIEFATYKSFDIATIARDYKVAPGIAQALLEKYRAWWTYNTEEQRYYPSRRTRAVLRMLGVEIERKEGKGDGRDT